MPSGGHHSPTAFIFLVNSHSKKIPLPPHHGARWAHTAILYSFAASCNANNVCFRKWIEDILPRLSSTPANQAESLTMSLTTTGWSARKSPATCRRVTSASITRSTGPSSARRVRWSSAAPTTTGRSGWRSRAAIRRWCGIRGSASRRRYQPSATRSTTPEY